MVGLHIALALLYNARTPFGNNGYANTPDEGAHFQYVAYVAQAWRLPLFAGYAGVGYEAHQPPLYYFLTAVLYHLVGGAGKGVRLLSTLFSAGVVWLTWLCARRLLPDRPLIALTATGFVAFLPMHIAIGSAVGNDALTNLLFAGVLYGLLKRGSSNPERQALWVGILTGLALLTKATAILLLPVVGLGVLIQARLDGAGWQMSVRRAGLALLPALLIGGWWFIRNALLYDDPLLQKTFLNVFAGTAKAQDFLQAGMSWGDYLRLVADWTFRSFWFAYGTPRTANTGAPNFLPFGGVYLAMLVWQLLTLAGVGRALRTVQEPCARFWLALGAFTILLVCVSFVLFVRIFFQAQGRYFYPALMPIAIFSALGWDGLLPDRWRTLGHLTLIAFWLLLALACSLYLSA